MWTTSFGHSIRGNQHRINLKSRLSSAASFVLNQLQKYNIRDLLARLMLKTCVLLVLGKPGNSNLCGLGVLRRKGHRQWRGCVDLCWLPMVGDHDTHNCRIRSQITKNRLRQADIPPAGGQRLFLCNHWLGSVVLSRQSEIEITCIVVHLKYSHLINTCHGKFSLLFAVTVVFSGTTVLMALKNLGTFKISYSYTGPWIYFERHKRSPQRWLVLTPGLVHSGYFLSS